MDKIYQENKNKYLRLKYGGVFGFSKLSNFTAKHANVTTSYCMHKCGICPIGYSGVNSDGKTDIIGKYCCKNITCSSKEGTDMSYPWCKNGQISVESNSKEDRIKKRKDAIKEIEPKTFNNWKTNQKLII